MDTIILDGKKTRDKTIEELKDKVSKVVEKYGRPPGLATVLVGEDKASNVYVNMKVKACNSIGMYSLKKVFSVDISIETLLNFIDDLNNDEKIDGILVQMPLPGELNKYKTEVVNAISPEKDVDGFHPQSVGLNDFGDETYGSCTPKGMIRLLEDYNLPIEGQEVVIVNRTNVIGKPLAMMFINRSATVTVCHSRTRDLDFHLKRADIIAVGVGRINFITADKIKEGVIILDAGINHDENGKLMGDVDFEGVREKCKAITPVPGGVGPMTIAMLMENTYLSFLKRMEKN